jgi:hypothetical protein
MNARSLAHTIIKNQQESSWSDDPFQLKGAFKGVKTINHKEQLSQFAEELVYQFGTFNDNQYSLDLSDLSEFDQNELARLYMECTDRETGECVHGDDFSIDNNFTCALLNMLQNDCIETREEFANVTRKNIITYYAESIQDVLNDACHNLVCALSNEAELYQNQDRETGEFYWSKY